MASKLWKFSVNAVGRCAQMGGGIARTRTSFHFPHTAKFSVSPSNVHRKALYAGTFDPPSCGHLDIISRALHLCDELVIAIAVNPTKKPIFTGSERANLLRKMVDIDIPARAKDVSIDMIGRRHHHTFPIAANFLVRGLRAFSDFEYEFRMALINRKMTGIETSFLMADEAHSHISSTLIRELARWKTTLPGFVPESISLDVFAKLGVPYSPKSLGNE